MCPWTKLLCLPLSQVIRRYHITDREDYKKYNKLCGLATKLVGIMKQLKPTDAVRIELTDQLLDKFGPPFLRPSSPSKRLQCGCLGTCGMECCARKAAPIT